MAANGANGVNGVNGGTMDVPAVVGEAIKTVAGKAGFKKPRFHIESGSNDGDGYTSIIYRAIVRDEDKSGPDELRLICKTTASDIGSGGPMMQFIYAAEDEFYGRVAPILTDIAKLQRPLPWPRCMYSKPDGARPCLVVDDKCPEGFRMADRRVALDEHHIRHALSQLGRLHGAAMAFEVQRPDEFNAIAEKLTVPYKREDIREMWKTFMNVSETTPDMMLERYPEGSPMHAKVKHHFSTFGEKFLNELLTPGREVGNSIIHGDCHLNNMLFQYDEAGACTGCCLIDFQTTRYSTTAQDLSTLLMCCTEKAMRDKHWDALLKHYHTVLQDTLRAAGIKDPDSVYSWEQFMRRLGDMAGYGLFVTPMILFAFYANQAEVKELQGSVASVLNESDMTSATINIKWSADMRRRVGDVIDDMVRWGWL
ncbi:uncharacterized protein LOC117645900 [Thrips palmi]|uniref:Uncharacterized protein LOC117645900 n=1 Tax=Thrips palmi TaxID=161013 RepID=A0A6P8YXK3_THRPL|nr:uncharacterized protein LOC117645900 [Thrips palmi]